MWKQETRESNTIKTLRLIQLALLLAALWFILWAHICGIVVWNKTFLESMGASSFNVLLYSASKPAVVYFEGHVARVRKTTFLTHPSPITREEP